MTQSTRKPTVLIVPGSFSHASFYTPIVDQLSAQGYEALAIDLPTVGRREDGPAPTMADDAAHVHSVAVKFVDEGKDVVLLTHSYGGIVGTESANGLAKADREAAGKKGGISRLIYLTSIVPPVGGSLASTTEGQADLGFLKTDGDYMYHDIPKSLPYTLSDLPEAEALAWAERTPQHSAVSFTGELTYPAYKYIPVSYIVCEADKILTPSFQREMVGRIAKESGRDVDVHVCNTGHCPNLSAPEVVVELVVNAIEKDL
ncbi:alpha/beta-hydrolase [Glonium stellatum]|uniref:Alpha/beta-hydrolase n=1 Tax=Glonium stellatum TaxID=574774 RepID=A0A8E2F8N2_9PEZI|nr:alpha/beta-hydrolase [Glonium stellatum]